MAAWEQVNRAQMEHFHRKYDSNVDTYKSYLETLKRLRDLQEKVLPRAATIKVQYRRWVGPRLACN